MWNRLAVSYLSNSYCKPFEYQASNYKTYLCFFLFPIRVIKNPRMNDKEFWNEFLESQFVILIKYQKLHHLSMNSYFSFHADFFSWIIYTTMNLIFFLHRLLPEQSFLNFLRLKISNVSGVFSASDGLPDHLQNQFPSFSE